MHVSSALILTLRMQTNKKLLKGLYLENVQVLSKLYIILKFESHIFSANYVE